MTRKRVCSRQQFFQQNLKRFSAEKLNKLGSEKTNVSPFACPEIERN